MKRAGEQLTLLDTPTSLPNGLIYRPNFITEEEEEILLAYIENLPLIHPLYKDAYKAKRRITGFGWGFNSRTGHLLPGPPLPTFLNRLQIKIGKWLQISPERVAEALITEYTPGAAIGWHVDRESFEKIIGISLKGWCTIKFRPLTMKNKNEIVSIELEPRSAYVMQDKVRWDWQHSVAAVSALRYSITLRTLPPGFI